MESLKNFEIWFVTGSQHLYGEETLRKVQMHADEMAQKLGNLPEIPVRITGKPVVTTPSAIYQICVEANNSDQCIGLITWMHTFSPAKMWIAGLQALKKPFVHLHTQYNRDIPWNEIDMDFMNLNQSAHGDREFGFIVSRLRKNRKVITGHWQDPEVHRQLGIWARAACGWAEAQKTKIARFGDNMREVAVTEGDKVEAQMRLGWSVNGFGIGELTTRIKEVGEQEIDRLVEEYEQSYVMMPELRKGGSKHASLREAARIEIGLRTFLKEGDFQGFTDTFEDLHGMVQLPGIAVQRLMNEGYGFGAEGDWKMAAMLHVMDTMASGLPGGNSFMEDYTYHLEPGHMLVLGAHMLEISPSLTQKKPSCEIHPLSIGGKDSPVRLVFHAEPGPAINVSMVDMGNRFRLIVNKVEAVVPPHDLPKLPVARVLWKPLPDLKTAATAWIYAGGAHHTCYSQMLTAEHLSDFADMAGMELLVIDENTNIESFRNKIRWNELYYMLAGSLR